MNSRIITMNAWLAISMALAAPGVSLAQDVTTLEVRKESADAQRTLVEIRVPMTLDGFDTDNPMDVEASELSRLTDDQGTDLLALHREQQQALAEQGYTTESALSYAGVADFANNRDIALRVAVDVAPADDARVLTLAGEAMFNFAGDGEPQSTTVADVPLHMPWDSDGFDTSIGPIKVTADGSAEISGVRYQRYTVSGRDNAVVAAAVVGGDDSAAVEFWSIAPQQFVLEDPSDTVTLEIDYASVRKVPVAFDLEFSVGL